MNVYPHVEPSWKLSVHLEGAASSEEWNTDEATSERMKGPKFEPIVGATRWAAVLSSRSVSTMPKTLQHTISSLYVHIICLVLGELFFR